jgi:hypothetical protein
MQLARKFGLVISIAAALALPAVASAERSPSDFENASKFCKALRAEMGTSTFRSTYGKKHGRRNAFGRCVRQAASEDAASLKDELDAARSCRAERKRDPDEFATTYGSNRNHRNAFGKCVSQHVREGEGDDESPGGEGEGPDEPAPSVPES